MYELCVHLWFGQTPMGLKRSLTAAVYSGRATVARIQCPQRTQILAKLWRKPAVDTPVRQGLRGASLGLPWAGMKPDTLEISRADTTCGLPHASLSKNLRKPGE